MPAARPDLNICRRERDLLVRGSSVLTGGMDNKLPYEAPELRLLGAVRDLTQGHASGSVTDADFPAGTPLVDETFSF